MPLQVYCRLKRAQAGNIVGCGLGKDTVKHLPGYQRLLLWKRVFKIVESFSLPRKDILFDLEGQNCPCPVVFDRLLNIE